MANTSNKNFPHAYGAGRCVAAFSLSHPGGVEEESLDADPLMMPPGLRSNPPPGPAESKTFTPLDPLDPTGQGNAVLTFVPDRQPYNATSFGVYVTGSGTAPLPYRDAYAPSVPAGVSARLNQVLPTTEIRPFKVVEETKLGSTHGQVVINYAQGEGGVGASEFSEAWYEVGLDWRIPPLKLTFGGADFPTIEGSFDSNWMARKSASVRDSLAGTLWATATYSDNSLSECHPDLDDNPIASTFTPAGVSSTFYNAYLSTGPSMDNYYEMPYGPTLGVMDSQFPEFNNGWIDPFEIKTFSQDMKAYWPPTVRAEVFLKTTLNRWTLNDISADLITYGPNFNATLEMEFAPVVRIWVLWPDIEEQFVSIPRALLRFVSRPNSGEDDPGGQPPCVNVNVWQKNSSAVDGTIKPVYDLYSEWGELGND